MQERRAPHQHVQVLRCHGDTDKYIIIYDGELYIVRLLNTCIILVGGRSDLFNSGVRWSKGEVILSKFRGELAKRGS